MATTPAMLFDNRIPATPTKLVGNAAPHAPPNLRISRTEPAHLLPQSQRNPIPVHHLRTPTPPLAQPAHLLSHLSYALFALRVSATGAYPDASGHLLTYPHRIGCVGRHGPPRLMPPRLPATYAFALLTLERPSVYAPARPSQSVLSRRSLPARRVVVVIRGGATPLPLPPPPSVLWPLTSDL